MFNSKNRLQFFIGGLVIGCIVSVCLEPNQAQEFRIESEIYVGDELTPATQNLTLFTDGMIYDFQMSSDAQPTPTEIIIFDTRDRYFILIDLVRNRRLRLDQIQIIQMFEGLRQQTTQNERSNFLISDVFEEELEPLSGWAELKSPNIEYRFQGKRPVDATILPTYFEFLDQFTRLKASDPTNLPPFPRLKLNQTIKNSGWIPSTVEVKLYKNGLFRSDMSFRSKHSLVMNLSGRDRKRIKDAKTAWMQTPKVDLLTYRNLKSQSWLQRARVDKTETKDNITPVIDD